MINLDEYTAGDLKEALAKNRPPNLPRSPWDMRRAELITWLSGDALTEEQQAAVKRFLSNCKRRIPSYTRPETGRDAKGRARSYYRAQKEQR